ncbi:MAG: peroxiredoxin [Candidatus Methanomethylicaceae archaeon]
MADLKVGDSAPDFSLLNENGLPVSLKDYLGKSIVVLYFYPKDFTSGCTTEACSFRDDYKIYQDKGAVVIGVSLDSVESHSKFSQEYKLPFLILSDNSKEVAKAYGVLGVGGFLAKRVTFIINRDGKITHVFPKVDVKHHSEEVLKAIEELQKA